MDDLIAFLRARLDEDEQTARAAGNRCWLVQDNIIELHPQRDDDGYMSWPTRADARHAATWEPARVLREVEAKRKLIDYASDWTRNEYEVWPMLAMLALAHTDHPDYRAEEWKP